MKTKFQSIKKILEKPLDLYTKMYVKHPITTLAATLAVESLASIYLGHRLIGVDEQLVGHVPAHIEPILKQVGTNVVFYSFYNGQTVISYPVYEPVYEKVGEKFVEEVPGHLEKLYTGALYGGIVASFLDIVTILAMGIYTGSSACNELRKKFLGDHK